MALTNCPECGAERVSTEAVSCPHCGFGLRDYFSTLKVVDQIDDLATKTPEDKGCVNCCDDEEYLEKVTKDPLFMIDPNILMHSTDENHIFNALMKMANENSSPYCIKKQEAFLKYLNDNKIYSVTNRQEVIDLIKNSTYADLIIEGEQFLLKQRKEHLGYNLNWNLIEDNLIKEITRKSEENVQKDIDENKGNKSLMIIVGVIHLLIWLCIGFPTFAFIGFIFFCASSLLFGTSHQEENLKNLQQASDEDNLKKAKQNAIAMIN